MWDLYKPLMFGEDLDGCFTPPAGSDTLLKRFLAEQDSFGLHICKDCFPAAGGIHPLILPGYLGHMTSLVNCFSEREIMDLPPDDILLITKGTDHNGP